MTEPELDKTGRIHSAEAIAEAWQRERPGTDTTGMRVVTRLWQLAKIFGDVRRRTVASEGVDLATLDLLSMLRRSGAPYVMTTRELSRQSMVTAGAISQRLNRAEREGLITRTRHQGERAVEVQLSRAGFKLVDRLVGVVAETDQSLLSALNDAQREELDALLVVVLDDLQDRYGTQAVSHVGAD